MAYSGVSQLCHEDRLQGQVVHTCPSVRAVEFGISQMSVMPCSRQDDHNIGVTMSCVTGLMAYLATGSGFYLLLITILQQ